MNTPSTSVSPGLAGFIAFFVLAVALWLLMRNMNTRLRGLSYREEQEQRRAAELAARAASDKPSSDPDQPPTTAADSEAAPAQPAPPGTEPPDDAGRRPDETPA